MSTTEEDSEEWDKDLTGQSEDPVIFKVNIPKIYSNRFLKKYAIISWFLPTYTQWELREVLRQRAIEKQFPELGSYLQSKKCCLMTLYLQTDLTHSDLFGNLLKTNTSFQKITIKKDPENGDSENGTKKVPVTDFCTLALVRPAKAKPKVFRRGYNDHGSYREDHEKGRDAFKYDYQSDLLQEEIDLKRAQFSLLWRYKINQVLARGCI